MQRDWYPICGDDETGNSNADDPRERNRMLLEKPRRRVRCIFRVVEELRRRRCENQNQLALRRGPEEKKPLNIGEMKESVDVTPVPGQMPNRV